MFYDVHLVALYIDPSIANSETYNCLFGDFLEKNTGVRKTHTFKSVL